MWLPTHADVLEDWKAMTALMVSSFIIECDSILYVGMTQKQNGGCIPGMYVMYICTVLCLAV